MSVQLLLWGDAPNDPGYGAGNTPVGFAKSSAAFDSAGGGGTSDAVRAIGSEPRAAFNFWKWFGG